MENLQGKQDAASLPEEAAVGESSLETFCWALSTAATKKSARGRCNEDT